MLIQLFIVFLCLFESSSAQCMGTDKLISETCFTFVDQPMSFEDARDYCHYRNNRWSYLGIVSNRIESNFVAAYASSMFNNDHEYFWIGLKRWSSQYFELDDGRIATFTNWELGEPNKDYVAESTVNGKWKTFASTVKMPFICSYSIYGSSTTPSEDWSTTPSAGSSTTPSEDWSTTPSAVSSTTPDEGWSTTPSADSSTTPSADWSTTPSADSSTTPSADWSTFPFYDSSTTPSADWSTFPFYDWTTQFLEDS